MNVEFADELKSKMTNYLLSFFRNSSIPRFLFSFFSLFNFFIPSNSRYRDVIIPSALLINFNAWPTFIFHIGSHVYKRTPNLIWSQCLENRERLPSYPPLPPTSPITTTITKKKKKSSDFWAVTATDLTQSPGSHRPSLTHTHTQLLFHLYWDAPEFSASRVLDIVFYIPAFQAASRGSGLFSHHSSIQRTLFMVKKVEQSPPSCIICFK